MARCAERPRPTSQRRPVLKTPSPTQPPVALPSIDGQSPSSSYQSLEEMSESPEGRTTERPLESTPKTDTVLSPLFTLAGDATRTSWSKRVADEAIHIQIRIEREGMPNGALIYDQVVPHLLFCKAPALQGHMEGNQILLRSADAINEDAVSCVVHWILHCSKDGSTLESLVARKFIPMIKVHCILDLFEMHKEADILQDALWDLFEMKELRLKDIQWIWDTFAAKGSRDSYVAPSADVYVQMMAWQILNMDHVGRLSPNIRQLIQAENSPYYFRTMLEVRKETYGLAKELSQPAPEVAGQEDIEHQHDDAHTERVEEHVQVYVPDQSGDQKSSVTKDPITPEQFPIYQKSAPATSNIWTTINNQQSHNQTPRTEKNSMHDKNFGFEGMPSSNSKRVPQFISAGYQYSADQPLVPHVEQSAMSGVELNFGGPKPLQAMPTQGPSPSIPASLFGGFSSPTPLSFTPPSPVSPFSAQSGSSPSPFVFDSGNTQATNAITQISSPFGKITFVKCLVMFSLENRECQRIQCLS